jgi:hypothetical protein
MQVSTRPDNPDVTREEYVERVLRDELSADDLRALRERGIPYGHWNRAALRYNLTPVVVGGASRGSAWVNFVDGEREYFDLSSGETEARTRAPVRQIEINWTSRAGVPYFGVVSIDEGESMSAVEKLTKGNPQNALTLVIDVSQAPAPAKVSLRDSRYLLPLSMVRTQIESQ